MINRVSIGTSNQFLLKSFFFSFNFHRFSQSGYYLDFFLKKWSEVFVRNVYIYASQFIGEKYMIEELTKKIFDRTLWRFNKHFGLTRLFYSLFFIQTISFLFYLLGFIYFFLL